MAARVRMLAACSLALLCCSVCVAGEADKLSKSVGEAKAVSSLPEHVEAPEGQLTLFADFKDVRKDGVVLYLVNRTDDPVKFPAQGGDIFVKLECKDERGNWVRAQTHVYGWCGNDYHAVNLKPGHYFKFLGYLPAKGGEVEVRYRRYAGRPDLVSNVGKGRVSLDERWAAGTDSMAIRTGSLAFVSAIATGKLRVTAAKSDWMTPRQEAILTLAVVRDRFSKEDVAPILKALLEDDDKDVARWAQGSLELMGIRGHLEPTQKAAQEEKE
jgi:hypothetical protein